MRHSVVPHLASPFHARIRGFLVSLREDEDAGRRRILLYTVLAMSLGLSCVCFLLTLLLGLRLGPDYRGIPWWAAGAVSAGFGGLLLLTRAGYVRLASAGVFIAYLVPSMYASARWGIDLPQALLLDAFLIVMTSVLFGTRSALILSAGISVTLFFFSWLGTKGILSVNRYWHDEVFTVWDGVAISATLLCVAFLCRLANHEIERSLIRARESEKLLRMERDSLEIRVEERTKELRLTQLEKMTQLVIERALSGKASQSWPRWAEMTGLAIGSPI